MLILACLVCLGILHSIPMIYLSVLILTLLLVTMRSLCLVVQLYLILWDPTDCSLSVSSVHGDSPGKNTGVGCHALLQRIFPVQGSNPGFLHCKQIHYCLGHQESLRILVWVVYPFSRRSSKPRNWIGVSCIAGGFFTSWATREAPLVTIILYNSLYLAEQMSFPCVFFSRNFLSFH